MSFPNVPNVPPGWNDPPSNVNVLRNVAGLKRRNGRDNRGSSESSSVEEISAAIPVESLDKQQLASRLITLLKDLETQLKSQNSGESKLKMMEDCRKRVEPLIENLENQDSTLDDSVESLHIIIDAMSQKDFAKASKIITKLMTSGFSSDSGNNQWVLGLKRLVTLATNV